MLIWFHFRDTLQRYRIPIVFFLPSFPPGAEVVYEQNQIRNYVNNGDRALKYFYPLFG